MCSYIIVVFVWYLGMMRVYYIILELECKVLRKYYIQLAPVLFINNISRYFLSEFILDHREFDKVCDPFAHKDKATTFLNIVHRKMKAGDTGIFRTMLDTLHFYGDKPVRVVVDKMKTKLFEMKVNKRGDIEQRRSDRIAGMLQCIAYRKILHNV